MDRTEKSDSVVIDLDNLQLVDVGVLFTGIEALDNNIVVLAGSLLHNSAVEEVAVGSGAKEGHLVITSVVPPEAVDAVLELRELLHVVRSVLKETVRNRCVGHR